MGFIEQDELVSSPSFQIKVRVAMVTAALAANAAITAESTDSDIQFTVNQVFSDIAGVTTAEAAAV